MDLIWLIPILPGLGAAINGLIGIRAFNKQTAALVACGTMALALALSLNAFWQLLGLPAEARDHVVTLGYWIPPIPLQTVNGIGAFEIPWAFRLDPLSAMMILVVTGIGFLIHVYSTAYMHDEPRGGYARFFCYLNLFCFFMLVARARQHLPDDVRRLGGRGPLLVSAHRLLVRKEECVGCRQESVYRQPDRRLGLRARRVSDLLHVRHARLPRRRPRRVHDAGRNAVRRPLAHLPAALRRRHRKERADSPVCLVTRRHGRPDAGVRAHPCGDDGDRRACTWSAATPCSSATRRSWRRW